MGKNYIENSLKRFLKRKVKITLGFVVSFMITGICAFAEGTDSTLKVADHNKPFKDAVENLKGLGENSFKDFKKENITINNTTYTVEMKDNILTLTKTKDNTTTTINLEKKDISDKLKTTIDNILANLESPDTSDLNVNNSILMKEQSSTTAKATMINNGIVTTVGQVAKGENQTLINNGVLINITGSVAQQNAMADGAELINNGLINSTGGDGQKLQESKYTGVTLINNGIINAPQGQSVSGKGNKAINYGIINTTGTAQICSSELLINYGIINARAGQYISGEGNKLYNYGLISATSTGITAKDKTDAYNYGVVNVSDAGNAFSGDVINEGIVIADNGTLADKYNTGILLNSNYDLREDNTDTKVFHSGDTVESFGEKNTFGESITKGYVKNESVNIDNTQGKVIGAVVTEKLDNAVFNYAGNKENENDLFLKDTTITGYFETDGTLLDVGTGNLTLGGDTNITAVKNNFDLDVTAVQLGENGKITIMDDAKINGIIKGNDSSEITFTQSKGEYKVDGDSKVVINIGEADPDGSRYQQYFDVTLSGSTDGVTNNEVSEIKISTENGVKDLTNKLVIENGLTVKANDKGLSIYDTNTTNKDAELEIIVDSIHSIEGNVQLGVGKDTFTVKSQDPHGIEDEGHKDKFIDLGGGEDKFIAEGTDGENIFGYNVKNAETVELKNGTWGEWNKAGSISFGETAKAGDNHNLSLGNGTTIKITLSADKNHGSDFADYVGNTAGLDHITVTGTGVDSKAKFWIDEEKGLDSSKLHTDKYSFGEGVEYKNNSAIFNIESTKDNGTTVTIKTAEEMGLSGQERIIYEAYLKQIEADGNVSADIIKQINRYESSKEFADLIKQTHVTGEAYYTAGSVVTMDIADTYLSSVEDFTKRAGKGEWLAQGKYVGSDTEFDGGSKVKGYDGDVTGTVGMIEYGFTENTSYGVAYGQGDSEMDIQGGGKLDGDNTYFGAFMKHRTQNGIELVANVGYVENDMDSVLRNDFNFNNKTNDNPNGVSSNGKAFEKGTADSSAVILSVKGRKDYRITDTIKLQPILGARATFINQEKAENPEMHFTIAEQDIIVVEGTAGMGIAKEFAMESGKLEFNTGVEYTFAATSTNNDAEYTLFEGTDEKPIENDLEDCDAAENTGTFYAGFDYEHESGVGFNGKYEMMWSDKGDDSRITAGVSYRF